MASKSTGLILVLGVAALAVYLSQGPAPKMSASLLSWKAKGTYFKYKNHQIFYVDHKTGGDPQNPALICLHGFPSSSFDWIKMWDGLVKREKSFSRIIAIDFLGYGFSDKPLGYHYTVKEQADIYESLLSKLGVKDVHVLAHDFGDTVAQEMLARFNQRSKASKQDPHVILHSVCLLNGGIFPETNFPLPSQRAMRVPYLGGFLARLSNQFIFSRGFGVVFGPHTQPTEEEFTDFYAAVRYNDGHLVLPSLLDYIAQRAENRDRWTGALQDTSVPVHVIWGLADPVNPPGFVEFYKKTVPEGGITMLQDEDIGHYPQWEDPEGVIIAYFTFIESIN